MGSLQRSNMSCDALYKRRHRAKTNVVASFKARNESAISVLISGKLKLLGQPLIVEFIDACGLRAMNEVLLMRIEAGRTEDKVGLELIKP